MRAAALAALMASAAPAFGAPAGTGQPDLAAEYRAAKDRRDRAAAEVARQSRLVIDAGSNTAARLAAARALENAQSSLQAAETDFSAVVRKMKPGDAIWIQETAVGVTGRGADRYQTQIPAIGDGAALDPTVQSGQGLGDSPDYTKPLPPLRGPEAPGVGTIREEPHGGVGYGLPPGFANDRLDDMDSRAGMIPPSSRRRDPRRVRPSADGEEPFDAPTREGEPFTDPLPPEAVPLVFVRLSEPTRFPILTNPRRSPGGGALGILAGVARDVDKGDLAGAWKGTEALLAQHPDDPGVRSLAAGILLRLGRAKEAEEHARAAIRLGDESPDPWTVLAWALLRQGRRREAAEAARRALDIDPAAAGAAAALRAAGPAGSGQPPAVAPPAAGAAGASSADPGPAPEAPPASPARGLLFGAAAAAVAAAAIGIFLRPRLFRRRA